MCVCMCCRQQTISIWFKQFFSIVFYQRNFHEWNRISCYFHLVNGFSTVNKGHFGVKKKKRMNFFAHNITITIINNAIMLCVGMWIPPWFLSFFSILILVKLNNIIEVVCLSISYSLQFLCFSCYEIRLRFLHRNFLEYASQQIWIDDHHSDINKNKKVKKKKLQEIFSLNFSRNLTMKCDVFIRIFIFIWCLRVSHTYFGKKKALFKLMNPICCSLHSNLCHHSYVYMNYSIHM